MKVSVFITSYNQKGYLAEAVESVLAQTLKPFEVIIVDDCSTDGSSEVIEGYRSKYPGLVKPVYHERNTGVARVRIDALQAVKGDYVTYVDGDDRFLPTKLEKEAKALKESGEAGIAFSNNYYMTEDGSERTGVWVEDVKPPEGDVFVQTFAREFPKNNLFRMELVDYRAWQRIGFHDQALKIYEDYDMRIRLTKELKTVYHDEPLSEIRTHGKGLSKSDKEVHLRTIWYVFNKNRRLLADLDRVDRRRVEKRVRGWMARLARKASIEALSENHRKDAVKYFSRALGYDCSLHGIYSAARLLPGLISGKTNQKPSGSRDNKPPKL